MINLWDYTKKIGRIRVLKTDGTTVEGRTVCVTDKDEAETEEDFIVIDLDDGDVAEIVQSEVKSIERV